jgi:hypothetical protein
LSIDAPTASIIAAVITCFGTIVTTIITSRSRGAEQRSGSSTFTKVDDKVEIGRNVQPTNSAKAALRIAPVFLVTAAVFLLGMGSYAALVEPALLNAVTLLSAATVILGFALSLRAITDGDTLLGRLIYYAMTTAGALNFVVFLGYKLRYW